MGLQRSFSKAQEASRGRIQSVGWFGLAMAKCRWCYGQGSLGRRIDGEKSHRSREEGAKCSLMTDALGIPVGLAVDRTNVHDIGLLQPTIENCFRHLGFEQTDSDNTFAWTKVSIQRRFLSLLKQATTRCHIFVRAGKRSALSEADFSRKTRALGSRTNTWIAQSISIHPYPMAKEG
jgi:hypothetical protein